MLLPHITESTTHRNSHIYGLLNNKQSGAITSANQHVNIPNIQVQLTGTLSIADTLAVLHDRVALQTPLRWVPSCMTSHASSAMVQASLFRRSFEEIRKIGTSQRWTEAEACHQRPVEGVIRIPGVGCTRLDIQKMLTEKERHRVESGKWERSELCLEAIKWKVNCVRITYAVDLHPATCKNCASFFYCRIYLSFF